MFRRVILPALAVLLAVAGCSLRPGPVTTPTATGTSPGQPTVAPGQPHTMIAAVPARLASGPGVIYLDRGRVRLTVDMRWGGAIREIALDGQNMINNYDGGRLLGISLYDSSRRPHTGHPNDTGWNPTPSDWHNSVNIPITSSFSAHTLYVKSNTLQWFPEDKGGGPGHPIRADVVVETWISYVADTALRLRYRVTHTGTDSHTLAAQEYPFAYIRKPYGRFVRYDGATPWTSGPAKIDNGAPAAPSAGNSAATENWAAFVDSADLGLTMWAPQAYSNVTFKNFPNPGPPENATNYLLPMSFLNLGPGATWETEAYVFVGRWQDARADIYRLHQGYSFPDTMPSFGFVDQPHTGATVSGTIDVAGWVIDDRSVARVELLIDGNAVGQASYGAPRPDVARDYPGVPKALGSGYAYHLDTTAYPNGQHTLQVRAFDVAGHASILLNAPTVNINNSN